MFLTSTRLRAINSGRYCANRKPEYNFEVFLTSEVGFSCNGPYHCASFKVLAFIKQNYSKDQLGWTPTRAVHILKQTHYSGENSKVALPQSYFKKQPRNSLQRGKAERP